VTAIVGLITAAVEGTRWALGEGWGFVDAGITVVLDEPERLYHVFVRSGRIPEYVDYRITQQETIDLALLEVTPLFGGLLGLLGAGLRRLRTLSREAFVVGLGRPARQTDLLAVAVTLSFVLMNLERLPLHTQITVRYLVPVVPLGLYGIARLGPVGRVARADTRWLAGAYFGTLAIGGVGFLAAHALLGLALGEAMQLHALVNLASAGLLAIWALIVGFSVDVDARVSVVAVTVPAALTTLFLGFAGLGYFDYAQFALPLAEAIAELLPVAV
jgi:hypothetical protein